MKDIDRWNGIISCCIECDYCREIDFVEETDWIDVIELLKANGWRFKKIDGEWRDFCCEECRDKYMAEHTFDHFK